MMKGKGKDKGNKGPSSASQDGAFEVDKDKISKAAFAKLFSGQPKAEPRDLMAEISKEPTTISPSMQETGYKPRIINVQSLDFDNCMFHRGYKIDYERFLKEALLNRGEKTERQCELEAQSKALEENQTIGYLKFIIEKAKSQNYYYTILFVGSNRQYIVLDDINNYNINKNGSAFTGLIKICDCLQEQFKLENIRGGLFYDKFLQGDMQNGLPYGTTFDQQLINYGLTKATKQNFVEKTFFDESKFVFLYAQMHKVAAQYPNDLIFFDFVDDKHSILSELRDLFETYPELLPPNLVFNLYKYEGAVVDHPLFSKNLEQCSISYNKVFYGGLRGHAYNKIDYNYKENLKKILEIIGYNFENDYSNFKKDIDIASELNKLAKKNASPESKLKYESLKKFLKTEANYELVSLKEENFLSEEECKKEKIVLNTVPNLKQIINNSLYKINFYIQKNFQLINASSYKDMKNETDFVAGEVEGKGRIYRFKSGKKNTAQIEKEHVLFNYQQALESYLRDLEFLEKNNKANDSGLIYQSIIQMTKFAQFELSQLPAEEKKFEIKFLSAPKDASNDVGKLFESILDEFLTANKLEQKNIIASMGGPRG